MKKNVSGQKIGAQLISATDGSAFTGSVTAYVCGDAGTQNAGSVGSGACTHEGNGYHTYAPAQAETNYDLIAFTFTGSGAIPVTVQVYTAFPQTGDAYALLPAQPAAVGSAMTLAANAINSSVIAANAINSTGLDTSAITEIQSGLSTLDAAGVRTAIGLASANIDTQLGDLPTAAENADALLGRNVSGGSSAGRLVKEALYFLRNKWNVSAGTLTVYGVDDSTPSWTATVGTDASAEPIISNDPG